MKVIYAVLLCLASAQFCWDFVCNPPGVNWPAGLCGMLNSTNSHQIFLNTESCAAGEFCSINNYGNSTCIDVKYQQQLIALAGEPCNANNQCFTGTCENGTCSVLPKFSPCVNYYDCGLNNNCIGGVCYPLSRIGGQCISDTDCVQNAGCDNADTSPSGICVEYLSLGPGKRVNSCIEASEGTLGRNLLCESTTCFQSPKDHAYYCSGFVRTNGNIPVNCNVGACTSARDPYSSYVALGACLCSHDGNAYCAYFPGDEVMRNYLEEVKEIIHDPRYLTCNTGSRLLTLPPNEDIWCIKARLKPSPRAIYNYYMAAYGTYVMNTEECVVKMLMPEFYNATRGYHAEMGRP